MCNPLQMLGVPSGPSATEESIGAQESTLSRDLNAKFEQEYGQQQDVLKQLTAEIGQVRSGRTGPGFGAEELAARTSQIENAAAAGERNARQAVRNQTAGQQFNGSQDASGLAQSSAIHQQIDAEIASGGEIGKANALTNLTAENYEQGRRNARDTIGGLNALAGRYDPLAYARESSNAGGQAFGEAGKIRELQDAHAAGIGGLIESGISMAGDFMTGGLSGLAGTGGEGFFGKTKDFLKGGYQQAFG